MNFVDSDILKNALGKQAYNKIFDDGDKSVNSDAVNLIIQGANSYVYGRIAAQFPQANINTDSPGFVYLRLAATEMAKGMSFQRSPEYQRRYILGDTKQEMKLPFDMVETYINMAKTGGAILSNGASVLEAQAAEYENLQDKPSIFNYDYVTCPGKSWF